MADFMDGAERLLSEDDHGIPTVTAIKNKGRRYLDDETFQMEKKAEKKRVSRIRRTKISAEEMEQLAATTTLTNDAMFEIAETQLEVREKIAKMALVKFWDSLVTTIGVQRTYKVAEQSMPLFHQIAPLKAITLHGYYRKVFNRANNPQLAVDTISRKTQLMKLIGYYMKMTKRSVSLIHAFAHGDRSSDKKKLVPKCDQKWTKEDILWGLGFFEVGVEEAWSSADSAPPVVKSTLKTFTQLDPHYSNFALEDNTSALDSRANREDDADDEFGDIDFLDHCVQDVFEDYTD